MLSLPVFLDVQDAAESEAGIATIWQFAALAYYKTRSARDGAPDDVAHQSSLPQNWRQLLQYGQNAQPSAPNGCANAKGNAWVRTQASLLQPPPLRR
jgi:hypothetical protein